MPFEQIPYTNFHGTNQDWMIQQIKQMIATWASYQENFDQWRNNLDAAFNALHDYVYTYFDELDVQEEINNKLDQMREDGVFAEILQPYFDDFTVEINNSIAAQNGRITTVENEVNNFLENTGTLGTEKDPELIDIRVGADNVTYATAGAAVRGQVSNLNTLVNQTPFLSATNAITIPDNSDFDTYKTVGTYKVTNNTHAATMSNMPAAIAGKLVVLELSQQARLMQFYFGVNTATPIWARSYLKAADNEIWTAWESVAYRSLLTPITDRITDLENNQVLTKNKLKFKYDAGNFASGKATERISIYIPATSGYLMYRLYHFIDTDNNSNCWQLYHIYHVDDELSNQIDLTVTGEYECAVHLANRDDFSGGHTHGDEIINSIQVLIDGAPVDFTTLTTETDCNEIIISRTSLLYDPADHVTEIAEHGVEYVFNKNGLVVNQSLKWLVAETLTNCFLAMFLPLKTKLDRAIANSDFEILQLATDTTETLTTIVKEKANAVTMWDTGGGLSAAVSVPEYPTGLTDGDVISISDNGGLNYNKVYFKVCGGGTSSVGELWKSITIYKLDYKA